MTHGTMYHFPSLSPRVFPAVVTRAYDGDTLELVVDHGMGQHVAHPHSFRLYGVDTPELRGPGADLDKALAARDFALEWLGGGNLVPATHARGRRTGYLDKPLPCFISSHDGEDLGVDDLGRYGRWLIEVMRAQDGPTLNDALVDEGYATRVSY